MGGVKGHSQVYLYHDVLDLVVIHQKPCRKVHLSVREADFLAQSGPIHQDHPCHTKAIGLFVVAPNGTTRLTGHTHHITYIFV